MSEGDPWRCRNGQQPGKEIDGLSHLPGLGEDKCKIGGVVGSKDRILGFGTKFNRAAGFVDSSDPACTTRWTITNDATPPHIKTITVRSMARRKVLGLEKEVVLATRRAL
jgi:hypothetical protein